MTSMTMTMTFTNDYSGVVVDHVIILCPKYRCKCHLGMERTTVSHPSPGSDKVPTVQGKIINSVASVFILTAKTLVIAKFMILAKVKLRCESNRR